jgi:hypothetical protein
VSGRGGMDYQQSTKSWVRFELGVVRQIDRV